MIKLDEESAVYVDPTNPTVGPCDAVMLVVPYLLNFGTVNDICARLTH